MIRCSSRAENLGRSSYSSGVRTKEICLRDQFLSIFPAVHVCVRAHAEQPLSPAVSATGFAARGLAKHQPNASPKGSNAPKCFFSQKRESGVIPWDKPRNSKARAGFAMLENQE